MQGPLSTEEQRDYEARMEEFSSFHLARQKEIAAQYKPYVPKNNSIAKHNKNTGLPHEHKREIARRLRQK